MGREVRPKRDRHEDMMDLLGRKRRETAASEEPELGEVFSKKGGSKGVSETESTSHEASHASRHGGDDHNDPMERSPLGLSVTDSEDEVELLTSLSVVSQGEARAASQLSLKEGQVLMGEETEGVNSRERIEMIPAPRRVSSTPVSEKPTETVGLGEVHSESSPNPQVTSSSGTIKSSTPRLKGKPLAALLGASRPRVGLSRSVNIESLHKNLQRK